MLTPAAAFSTAGFPDSVRIDHLTVSYGRRVALQDVSLSVQRGSYVGVLGPNGAGKSTLLKAIIGIAPCAADAITINDQPLSAARHSVAYVPQSEEIRREFPVTAFDVALMGRYRTRGWLRLPSRRDRELARSALEQVGMLEQAAEPISRLSGGQLQRVFIARALAQEPKVLLLDEPMNGVDLPTRELIQAIVERLRGEGKTILMATHDIAAAAQCCSCLCCINQGLIAYGTTAETLQPEVLERTFGGMLPLGVLRTAFAGPQLTGASAVKAPAPSK